MRPARVLAALLALAALALIPLCCSHAEKPVDGKKALGHVETMVASCGVRPVGSENLKKAAEYLRNQCVSLGLKAEIDTWTDPKEKLEMRNVRAEIPGEDPVNGPILAIGAHYDTKLCEGHAEPSHNFRFVGAIDGTGGPAVLLELARVLKQRKNKYNIWLLWLDGEESLDFEWNKERALFGSLHFVNTMQADKTRFPKGLAARLGAFVLLDLVGAKNGKVDRDPLNSGDLIKIFEDAGAQLGESARMFKYEHKHGITDDHEPFKNYGVSVINLIDFAFRIPANRQNLKPGEKPSLHDDYFAYWHTENDVVANMSADTLAFFGNLVYTALPAIEKLIDLKTKK